jgi:hypothetical protein
LADHGPHAGASRNTENIGRHKRIAEETLIGCAGGGKCGSDEAGCYHTREANIEEDGVDRTRSTIAKGPMQDGLQNRQWWDAIGADPGRDHRHREQQDRQQKENGCRAQGVKSASGIAEEGVEIRFRKIDLIK